VTADEQRRHWSATFVDHPDMYGEDPSDAAVAAADAFAAADVETVLELGAGQGRDTLYLARRGFHVHALDYAPEGVEAIEAKGAAAGLADRVTVGLHDVRDPLPFADSAVDASYSHMLLCMALTTPEVERLVADLRRVLRPDGLVVYTVRTTDDPHYGAGVAHGDDMYEHGGFIVHFFDRALVEHLAAGFTLLDVTEFAEGELPRRLVRATMRRIEPPAAVRLSECPTDGEESGDDGT
jgi:SAM-dependent methyltransferase